MIVPNVNPPMTVTARLPYIGSGISGAIPGMVVADEFFINIPNNPTIAIIPINVMVMGVLVSKSAITILATAKGKQNSISSIFRMLLNNKRSIRKYVVCQIVCRNVSFTE